MRQALKRIISPLVLWLYSRYFFFRRHLFPRNIIASSALIFPPYSPGSFGDEAVITSVVRELRKQGVGYIGILSYSSSDKWDYIPTVNETFNLENYLLFESLGERLRFIQLVSRFEHLFALGTDVMDGYYSERDTLQRIEISRLASLSGTKTRIISFSFNENPKPSVVNALSHLPESVQLFSRDPISHQRLTNFLKRPVNLTADVAFTLEPEETTPIVASIKKWTREQRENGRMIIGINANHILIQQIDGMTPARLIEVYTKAIPSFLTAYPQTSFLLIPHDIRGEFSDVDLAENILAKIAPSFQQHCLIVPTPCHPSEIKAIVAELDFVLSGKMHLAIACLGQGTPVACITYQGKFEGLFKHFDLEGLTIDPDTAMLPDRLSEFFQHAVDRRVEIHEQILHHLPKVVSLARENVRLK